MSTFSSDRVGETIIPDLTKRFRRGYIDYFDRKNGTDRPVEEIPTRSIIPLDQFEELMKLLDDIVLFSAATPELATKFQGLWNRLDLPDKDDKDRIECTRMGLISFESYIKVFIYLLCGNGDLLRQIDAEKRGLGYILNNLSVPSPDGKSGLFDARYAGLFDTLRRYRNGITHSPSDTGVSESDILTVRKNPNDAYDELFLLTLTGLLLLLHHHAGYYRRYLDEHRPELPPEKAAAASPADDFDLERFKDTNDELAKEYGLQIIDRSPEAVEERGRPQMYSMESYQLNKKAEQNKENQKISYTYNCFQSIKSCLAQNPRSFVEFTDWMKERGWDAKLRGKNITFQYANNPKHKVRANTLAKNYNYDTVSTAGILFCCQEENWQQYLPEPKQRERTKQVEKAQGKTQPSCISGLATLRRLSHQQHNQQPKANRMKPKLSHKDRERERDDYFGL